jgi:hypothetical protein
MERGRSGDPIDAYSRHDWLAAYSSSSAGGSILSDVVLGGGAGVGVDVLFGSTSGTVVSSADPRGLIRWPRERHRGEQRRHRDHLSLAAAMSGAGLATALRPHGRVRLKRRRPGCDRRHGLHGLAGGVVGRHCEQPMVGSGGTASGATMSGTGRWLSIRRPGGFDRSRTSSSSMRWLPGVRLRAPQSKNVGKPLADHSIS